MEQRSLAPGVIALVLVACGGRPTSGHAPGDDAGASPAVALDVPHGRWARTASDLDCELVVDNATLQRFFAEHHATYLVDASGGSGVLEVYDSVSECSAVCLAVCADQWLCATTHCGARSSRDEDPDQTQDEAGQHGLPTTRRDDPPEDDDSGGGGGSRDDRFEPPDPGGHPGR